MKIAHTIARLVLGAWFLFSGIEYFLPGLGLQPLGKTPLAQEFTLAMIHSGLFAWIKLIEVIVGILALINRGVLPAALACAPLTVVIAYWNFVLDPGVVEYSFGILTIVCNAILIWPFRERLWPLLLWKSDRP
jgi:uncharacterized membrane protein YphA (DoxX/SURF4 family)